MIVERINEKFGKNCAVFTEEILDLFPEYSRQYVARLINEAERKGELSCFEKGIYYIHEKTFFGMSRISPDDVVEKRYLRSNSEVYGIYSGLNLLNQFGLTTQVPFIPEIVTNNEATRKREIIIGKCSYILRRSRCEITNENYAAYTVLQLFNDMDEKDVIDESVKRRITYFMEMNDVTLVKIIKIASFFSGKTIKRLTRSYLFNGTI